MSLAGTGRDHPSPDGRRRGTSVVSVVDLLQVWLALAGVGVVLLTAVLFTALRLGWGDFGDVDDEPVPAAAD
jgi:hypothetical protein